jgi:hypothetical protein
MNSIDVTDAGIVTTNGCGRCSYSVPRDAVKKAREQVKALIGSEVSQQAELDECSKKSFHYII